MTSTDEVKTSLQNLNVKSSATVNMFGAANTSRLMSNAEENPGQMIPGFGKNVDRKVTRTLLTSQGDSQGDERQDTRDSGLGHETQTKGAEVRQL